VKDNADGMSPTAPDLTDTMTKINTVCAPRSAHRAMMDGKHHGVALP
jgi:hypothetical protein